MDFTALIPLLEQHGAPLLADLLTTAATVTLGPAGGAAVGFVTHALASAVGATDTSAPSIAAAIQANPDHAAQVLPQVEAEHADLIQGAIQQAQAQTEQARIDEQNVENARDLEAKLVASGSKLEYVPVVFSLLAVAGMVAVSVAIGSGHMVESVTTGRVEGFWETVGTLAFGFWLGNTARASQRADQAINFAAKAPPAATKTARR